MCYGPRMRQVPAFAFAIIWLVSTAVALATEPATTVDKWRNAPPNERRKTIERLVGKSYGNLPDSVRQRNLDRTEECVRGFAEHGRLGSMPIEKLTDTCVKLVQPKATTAER